MNQRPDRSSFKNLKKDNNITTNTGFTLALQQYKALLKKNFLLTRRNKWPTIFQFLQQILIICAVQGAVYYTKVAFDELPLYQTITNPPLKPSPSIPPCEVKSFVKLPCYDFVWSGDQNPVIREIVLRIMKNNPGREIPNSKVISFRNKEDVDDWLYKNPMYTSGALHFVQKNDSVFSYGIQTNSTSSGIEYRGTYEDPTLKFQLPLQFAAEREIARYLLRDPSFSWNVFLEEYPHQGLVMDLPVFQIVSPMLFLFATFIFFISQITSLVTEKELKLRQAMTGMGLYDSAYWLSWLTWEAFMTLISSLLIIFCGMMFRFPFFLKNSFAIVFFLFFLFQLNLTAMAFMLSTFFSKSSSTSTVGFCIQLVAVLTQVLTLGEYPYSYGTKKMMLQNIWSLFPPNPFSRALSILLEAVQTPEDKGVSWSKRGTCGVDIDDKDCRMTINDCFIWLLATFVLWFVLAMYFDNIMPNAMGVRKSMLYFLSPGYWTGNGGQQLKEGSIFSFLMPTQHEGQHSTPDDEDVLEEENVVKQQQTHNSTDSNVAVQLLGIRKSYPGTFSIGNKLKRTSPYHAVKGLWVNFPKDQLFCLLGPNGAGKTTLISCLTGISPVTDGDALIYGHSIRSAAGMANIRKLIGVCPQFDILWDKLSGTEHLHLFGSIKGLSPATIKMITPASLAEVKLTDVANVRSGSYSGGMKRRLSVAIALIGDPKLVILDEPTTGMDPITRRHVWDIIENAKKGRAIVLTTHSMEEADILSDRIGIMAKGRMRCIGTSIRLKSRFGTGFVANINFRENNPEHSAAVKQFFKNHLDVVPKEENSIFLTFVIPHEKEALLSDFFSKLEEREEEFGISDIQLGLATLEEVFLNIAKQAELETAVAEGRLVTLTLSSGEAVEIPVGARFVGIPGTGSGEDSTGFMVEVYWDQDDTGTLCIAGHSQKAPIPEGVQLSSSTAATQQPSAAEPGTIYGVVIDPSLVSSENFQ